MTPIAPPTPLSTLQEQGDPVAIEPPPPSDDSPPPPGVLPESELEFPAEEVAPAATATPVPPVSIGTIFSPRRILWLFIVGLIVFTVSYGVQVAIWYRLRK
jgi:hypothetical protein